MTEPSATPGTPSTILIVDDEPVVLSALQQTLERELFHVESGPGERFDRFFCLCMGIEHMHG